MKSTLRKLQYLLFLIFLIINVGLGTIIPNQISYGQSQSVSASTKSKKKSIKKSNSQQKKKNRKKIKKKLSKKTKKNRNVKKADRKKKKITSPGQRIKNRIPLKKANKNINPVSQSMRKETDKSTLKSENEKNLDDKESNEETDDEEEKEPEFLLIDFTSEKKSDLWIAKAFEANVSHDIYAYQEIRPISRRDVPAKECQEDLKCILRTAHEKGVLLYLKGHLEDQEIHLKLIQTWNEAQIDHGSFSVMEGAKLAKIKLLTFRMMKPLLTKGGVLDQVRAKRKKLQNQTVPTGLTLFSSHFDQLMIAMMLFLSVPIIYRLFLFIYAAMKDKKKYQTDWVFPLYLIIFLFAGLLFSLFSSSIHLPFKDLALEWISIINFDDSTWVSLIGGFLWASIFIVNFHFIFRPLYKMEVIPQNSLRPGIKAFLISSSIRVLASATLHLVLFLWVGKALQDKNMLYGLPLVIIPIILLIVYSCISVMIEFFAFHCDIVFATENATENNTTHEIIRAYIEDYVEAFHAVLPPISQNSIYIAGKGRRILSYGGLWLKPRIVIGERLLEEAFPFDYRNFILENPIDESSSEEEKVEAQDTESLDQEKVADHYADMIGTVDKITKNDDQKSIESEGEAESREENNIEFSPPMDFLYGGLLFQMALIYRLSHWKMSFLNLIFYPNNEFSGILGGLGKDLRIFYDHYSYRYERHISDAFAIVGEGYHHLLQYLCYLKFSDSRLLSSEGNYDKLVSHSEAILNIVSSLRKHESDDIFQNFFKFDFILNHLRSLGNMYQPAAMVKVGSSMRERQIRIAKWSLVGFIAFIGTFAFLLEAIDFRAVYNDRIRKEKQIMEEQLKKNEEKEKNIPPPIGASQ